MRKRPATRRSTSRDREADARAERWLEELLLQGERASSKALERPSAQRSERPTRNRHQGNQ
jgi:hypothetical protein